MSDWLMKVIRAEAARLIELAREDPGLRADLRALADSILEATGEDDPPPPGPAAGAPPADEPLHELTIGRSPAHPSRDEARRPAGSGDDLSALVDRCRRKAEAAGAAAEGEAGPVRDLSAWAQGLIDAHCWMSREGEPAASVGDVLGEVAGCFDAVADALELAGRDARARGSPRALELLAEAQSALRRSLGRLKVEDDDQREVYDWLRAEAARRRVYLRRHMRADDPAEPSAWRALRERIADAASAGRREPREARSGEATRPRAEPGPSPQVAEVAERLAGRSVVLIGGLRRPDAQEALRRALSLDRVIWVETREHESYAGFEPQVARPDVAVVLLAIRWSSHGFGEVRHLCERHGKPLVRLPGGYGPNQVAAQILAQCSEQLPPRRTH